MPELLHLAPAPGLVVRDPATCRPLPPEGGHVADTTYWHRRLAEGSVSPVQSAVKATAKSPASAPAPTTRSRT